MDSGDKDNFWGGILKSMGVVFGDIGTSPIYTLSVIFAFTPPTRENVFGIISLVFWTLTVLVTLQYVWLAMSLAHRGQGGEIALREILFRLLKSSRAVSVAGILSFIGVSLLLGDGVITPAISILSAVEGLVLIPGLGGIEQKQLVQIAAIIAILLFIFQPRGTEKVAGTFGPIMVIWFLAITATGLASMLNMPDILWAANPANAIDFFSRHGFSGYFILSEVILCATGGEALYADMGQLGRKPIIRAWYLVFVALVINYMGQGVYAIQNPGAKNILFSMVLHQAPLFYIPFLVLTIMATIIASQAIISGVFSIVYQGITTRILPLLRVKYTSSVLHSQIYIGAVNWFLMAAVIFIMLIFRSSENLAAAYGLAVTGSMTITSIMLAMVFTRKSYWKFPFAAALVIINFLYLFSTFNKFPHGAYWSIVLAMVPFGVILIWTYGQRNLFRALRPLNFDTFLISYEQIYAKGKNISGTALFFTRQMSIVPPYVTHCIIRSNIIYEHNVMISINRTDHPYGVETNLHKDIGTGLDAFEVRAGYMEILDIEELLKANGISEKVIFYGIEDIVTNNPVWHVFSLLKKTTPNFVQFYKLPASKLQGVVTRLDM